MADRTRATDEFRGMPAKEALGHLESRTAGLTSEEVSERIRAFGRNEVPEKRRNPLLGFLKRFWGPMPWLLELAMVLTLAVNHIVEGILILVLLTLNAIIATVQSINSGKALDLLKSRLQVQVRVLRDGSWEVMAGRELVPGDVISLRLGDLVPADAYVLDGELSVDASALTGESLPCDVGPCEVLYSGSILRRGEAICLVVNTGADTAFGKTVSLVQVARPRSRQQELMFEIVQRMMILGVAASVVVALVAVARHDGLFSIAAIVIVFLMGAVPVALPAVMTIVQAVGATGLSHKGVLVTRLDSIEDASSIDTFCFDKTGTITQNRLAVTGCVAFCGHDEDDVVRMAALASRAEGMDAIDEAILKRAKDAGVDREGAEQLSYLPFDPANKRTEALVAREGRRWRIAKGSPQVIEKMCSELGEREAHKVREAVDAYSARGWRTIAVATSEEMAGSSSEGHVKLVGLLALSDPPRPDSAEMIGRIRDLDIRPLMLTGDNQAIACEVAAEVGIGRRIRRADELKGLGRDERLEMIQNCDGFAEVYPQDKFEIVKLLQDDGHMVGMTGDGVNDAPALKQAELGTAVSGATDVARASASVVLTHAGLGEIVDTVEASRQTYQRMLTWVINKVAKVVEVVVLFTAGYLWLGAMPISLLGMSLLVFANDFVTMSIASDNVVSTKSPNSWDVRSIVVASGVLGALFAVEDLAVIALGIGIFELPFDQLCTFVMLSLVFNTQFRILTVRERRHVWSSAPSAQMLVASIATVAGFALIVMFGSLVPTLEPAQIAILFVLGAVAAVGIDSVKCCLFRHFGL